MFFLKCNLKHVFTFLVYIYLSYIYFFYYFSYFYLFFRASNLFFSRFIHVDLLLAYLFSVMLAVVFWIIFDNFFKS